MNERRFLRALGSLARAGYEAGAAAGSWVVDGNTSAAAAAALLVGLEDGDPAVLDSLPGSPLSGEWADGPTPSSVLADVGLSYSSSAEPEVLDDLLRSFEAAFDAGVRDEVTCSAAAVFGLEPSRGGAVSDGERIRRSAERYARGEVAAARSAVGGRRS